MKVCHKKSECNYPGFGPGTGAYVPPGGINPQGGSGGGLHLPYWGWGLIPSPAAPGPREFSVGEYRVSAPNEWSGAGLNTNDAVITAFYGPGETPLPPDWGTMPYGLYDLEQSSLRYRFALSVRNQPLSIYASGVMFWMWMPLAQVAPPPPKPGGQSPSPFPIRRFGTGATPHRNSGAITRLTPPRDNGLQRLHFSGAPSMGKPLNVRHTGAGQTMTEQRRRGFGPPGQTDRQRGFGPPGQTRGYFSRITGGTIQPGGALAFAQAQADLAAKVISQLTLGDSAAISGNVAAAVQYYQAGGNAGATSVGPEIDGAGAPNVTQPYTQMAYQSNVVLATIDANTVQDPAPARALLAAMITNYQQAIASGLAATGGGPLPTPKPPPPPAPNPSPSPSPQPSGQAQPTNYTPYIIGGGVLAGVAIVAWALKGKR